jgi:hypothetical protein
MTGALAYTFGYPAETLGFYAIVVSGSVLYALVWAWFTHREE